MSNTSKKRKQNKKWTIVFIALAVLLIISFVVSRKDAPFDPLNITETQASDLQPHFKGNLDSELVLVEYSDFQCPACKAAAPDIQNLVDQFADSFKLEYRHYPLRSIHPNAQIAAQSAEAAAIQGKFWEMHDMLFDKQSEWGQSFNPKRYFQEYALALDLNKDQFMYDLESDIVKDKVNQNFDEAQSLNLPGTPSFVLNGESIDINTFVTEQLMDKSVPIVEATQEVEVQNEQ
jgi:protein-disulfide isomerase